ncbi:MAG: diaminopimelate decarboxylase, partial [Vampirovibrio sp.]|nr:diaminopimelate decarboxylase [Vampirovibrio sp.]
LYTVGSMKDVPGMKKYVAVDGGMGDNIRPALYQAQYTALVVNKFGAPVEETVTIVGKYCESGDVLIKGLPVPSLESGDTLAVLGTGAYNYTMSSNYNRFPRPATVLVENGHAHVLVQRETYDTIIQQDLIPAHLRKVAEATVASAV